MVKRWFAVGDAAIILELLKTDVVLDKPVYIGQTVLDISKLVMYQMLDQWKANPHISKLRLLGGDTDSFFMEVESEFDRNTILQWFFECPNQFDPEARGVLDTSNYPVDHPLYTTFNESRLGCFKDEAQGVEIEEFICLSPKQYSFINIEGDRENRAKGVKKYKHKSLSHEDYRNAYRTHATKQVEQKMLQSKQHVMRTIHQKKKALSIWESKRAWIGENESVPYGHHCLPKPMDIENSESDD